ncbi:MAG: urea carboxylase [Gammaproteobacteria bacterium]|nr:urea carboxylase [Gammaproteobacteria bacterium]
MFKRVLIANRGAIACRIIRTLHRLGVRSIAVYTRADAQSRHVFEADEAVLIGEGVAATSYLDAAKILEVARATGAEAIHPGYGFLSENAAFAEACEAAGISFIGPTPQQIRDFGLKHTARRLARACGMPLLPGTELLADVDEALAAAARIGYPVMLKSTAGGGGIGMQLCRDAATLAAGFETVQRLSKNNFADGGLYLEKFVAAARHVEVQIFGDGRGRVVALPERDCSLQRRNQKVVEESPAPNLPDAMRAALREHAVTLGESVGYRSAGTVEYVVDAAAGEHYFLEVNTRLQVEHGVTEQVMGIDLVEWMLAAAAGDPIPLGLAARPPAAHAIQVRLYAEDPAKDFQPAAGLITEAVFPDFARCDTWVTAGVEVSPFYDPLLAKIIVTSADREAALADLGEALRATRIAGVETNLDYLRQVIVNEVFRAGRHTTRLLAGLPFTARTIEVIAPGTDTTVQDHPGRVGYWAVGVPPSGPMDALSFRLANRLLGNGPDAAGLEITISGPTLRFNVDALVCLGGAALDAHLDGRPVPWWQPFTVPAGGVLTLGAVHGAGARAYLCVHGGLDVPQYLGSRATFTLGRFGGHGGRRLRLADVLHLSDQPPPAAGPALANALRPALGSPWTLRVIYGPHGAPDFFTPADIATFFATEWEVHYNSSRTGVRLIGPKPEWARPDGGEAGLHPSNLHDNAYAIGTVDFTGDMPVILGPDGPSLGGFVCPATVITADLWMLGQLRPGDRIRFVPVDQAAANALEAAQDELVATLEPIAPAWRPAALASPVLERVAPPDHPVGVAYRPSGDKYLLVEYGAQVLDINLRFRVHALMLRLESRAHPGIVDLTPGIRSLQIHYDSRVLKLAALIDELRALEHELGGIADLEVPARIVHLPLSWDDPATRLAIEKYMQSVRPDAPWCPSNLEFIRRINGLDGIDDVRRIVFGASYLVMGLGDVYLGAPVATPLDPRHRLVTTKYNPARTWTPENAVGIGGSYLCVYGMEGPGGYQFVGRTLQMWNRFQRTAEFEQPWLLRFFDQIRFYPVSAEELLDIRADFPHGRYPLQIENTRFSLREYNEFLKQNATSIATFKDRQQAAFEEERARWRAAGTDTVADAAGFAAAEGEDAPLAATESEVGTHVHGSIWQINVAAGARVATGDTLVVIESMKMEIAVTAERDGVVSRVLCAIGAQVAPGQRLLVLEHGEE